MDREKIIKGLEDIQKHLETGYSFAISWKSELIREAIALLKEQKDKVGKWIPVTNGRDGMECSICHDYAPSYQDGIEYLSTYCPNCGAKMEWR